MATGANWTDVSVSYTFASRDNHDKASKFSTGGIIVLLIFILLIILGIVGSIVELTKVGDIPDLNYQKLNNAAKFHTVV